MKPKLILLIFLIPGLVAAYMAWITWQAQDEGKWFFTAFALVFLVPLAVGLFRRKPPPEKQFTPTRFTPYWFMMIAALILLGVVVRVLFLLGSALLRLIRG